MKNLKTAFLAMALCFGLLSARAQNYPFTEQDYNKPTLFADLPAKLSLNLLQVENLLNTTVGSNVQFEIAPGFTISGFIVSGTKTNSVRSVVIRSTNRQGAVCTLTRVQRDDGSSYYLGRIISLKNSDAFEIITEGNGYALQKRHIYELMSE
jgi:hypothetical protein